MKTKFNISDNVCIFTYFTDCFNTSVIRGISYALKFLNIKHICAFSPEINPTRRPCYIHYKYSIVLEKGNEKTLKELFKLTAPQIVYNISQREGKERAKLNV